MDELLTAVFSSIPTFILPAVVALVAGWWALRTRHREKRGAIAHIHRELTTGDVARARHVMGSFLNPDAHDIEGGPGRLEVIRAHYDLCWAVERVDNMLRVEGLNVSFQSDGVELAPTSSQRRTRRNSVGAAIGWNLDALLTQIATIQVRYAASLGLDDHGSRASLDRRLGGAVGQRFVHLSSQVTKANDRNASEPEVGVAPS